MKFSIATMAFVLLPAALSAQTGQVVSQNGVPVQGNSTNWIPDVRAGATAQVTTTLPCGTAASGACSGGFGNVGTGSLELSVTGNGNTREGYPDWGFYYRYAGGSLQATLDGSMAFGDLRNLSSLSFDWFRVGLAGWNDPVGSVQNLNGQPITPADWAYKTPVVRLQLLEDRNGVKTISELVWEGYYNQCSLGPSLACANNRTVVDAWQRQMNMQRDNFWYVKPPTVGGIGQYSQNGACDNAMSFWAGGVNASSSTSLFASNGCLFGATVSVIGIAVGVGSQWPLPWHGAVDNVRLGFGEAGENCATLGGNANCALDANFDWVPGTTVPEPSTYALMAAGLVGLGIASRRRKRSKD
jgi:hypothetical protein